MKKILMLAIAPMRKNKGQAVSMFVFALITAMFLNIGLVMFLGIESFFDERAETSHAAHFSGIYSSGAESIEQGFEFMKNDPRVAETEKTYAIGGFGEYIINDANALMVLLFARMDKTQVMNPPTLIGESLPLTGDSIYIPYDIFLNGGFSLGDSFTAIVAGTELNFTIAGATEEITYGSIMSFAYRFYISDEMFNKMKESFPDNGITLLSARFNNKEDALFFKNDYVKAVSSDGLFYAFSYDEDKQPRLMIPIIISLVITAFAIVILIVSLIVIRFRIINGIEEGMINIGVQKAIGYRNGQIIAAITAQYGIIALTGGITGIALAQMLIPFIMEIIKPMLALVWNPGFDIITALVSVLLVLLTVMLIAFIASGRINKLNPLIALRGGITNHSFKKNLFPLDKSRISLGLLIALKQIFQNKKQAVTVCVITAAVTMASSVGIALNYSLSGGRDVFIRSLFDEVPLSDAAFMLKSGEEGEAFRESLLEYPEVNKVLAYQASGVQLQADETDIIAYVTEDYSLLESQMLVEGYYPKYDNEIALGALVLKAADKDIGDTVKILIDGRENDCIITGIVQSINSNGFFGLLTTQGIRTVQPDFLYTDFLVYMNEETDVKAEIERIQSDEGDIIETAMNMEDQIGVTLNEMAGMFAAAAAGILAVTVFVIVLTLYTIIKTVILRRQRELGIQKAVGFTALQLMNQITLNMIPVIILGVAIGAAAGYFGFNPLFALLTSGMGIAKVNLIVPLKQIIAVCVALIILAYTISMLITLRIRKISAYALVSE